jgi:glucose-1-phosphate adenylyltransferase
MNNTVIGDGCELNKTIVAENVVINNGARFGIGEEVENETDPHIYNHGLVCIGEKSVIPEGITIGKNACVFGVTEESDYENKTLESGKTLIKAGDEQ